MPPALYGWSLAAVLATAVAWPIVLHAGIPAFFHDWTWSPFRDRMVQSWQLQLSAWVQSGLGHPNSVPSVNPLAWLKVVLAVFLPADWSAKAYLWLSVVTGCAGVYRLARRTLHLDPWWSSFAATIFAGSPFLFAKISSGQSSEWAAIAAFVWGVSLEIDAFEAGSLSLAATAGLLFALSTNQLQYLVFAEIAALAGLVAYRGRRGLAIWATIAVACVVFALPAMWFLASRGPLSGADVSPPYRWWEYSQSSSLGDTFALLGYAAQYPETFLASVGPWALVAVKWASWAIAALALAGFLANRSRRTAVLAILGMIGIAWVSGVRGPAATIWDWELVQEPYTAFLREFFHGATLVGIAYAVLSAAALARLAVRARAVALVSATVLAAMSGMATWLGGVGPTLPHVVPPAYAADLEAKLPRSESRVLFVPSERPLFVRDDRVGGIDAFDWAGADQSSLFEYYPSGPIAYAAAKLASADLTDARRILSRIACDAIVWRPDVSSPLWGAEIKAHPGPPAGATPIAGGAFLLRETVPPMVSGARTSAPLPASLGALATDASVVYLDEPGTDSATLLRRDLDRPDPATGWVGYRDLYDAFADGLATPTLGVVTTKMGAALSIPAASGGFLLWAPHGAMVGSKKIVTPQYERIAVAGDAVAVTAMGPTAIGEFGERPVAADVRPSAASATRTAPWRYEGEVTISDSGLLVLRQKYDPGWTLRVDGLDVAGHFRADGISNAWLLKGNGRATFSIEYAPQAATFALLGLSLLLACAFGFVALAVKTA